MTKEEFISQLKAVSADKIIFFIGSGFVIDLGYPSWLGFLQNGADFIEKHSPEQASVMRSRIKKEKFLSAGDIFFQDEIPTSELYSFFRTCFDKNPTILPVYKKLFSCPFSAFITTNFDRTIEQSLAQSKKNAEVFAEDYRFKQFNSRLSVYAENVEQRLGNGLILKLHGSITIPESIIVGSKQLDLLVQDKAYQFLYKHLLSSYTIVYVGYSGKDPIFQFNCKTLFDIAGVPSRSSFFLHPKDENPPDVLIESNIMAVPYDRVEGHKELYSIIDELGTFFAKPDVARTTEPIKPISDETRDTLAFLCVGINQNTYSSSYQCAIVGMIAEATRRAGNINDPEKIISALSRIYHISISDAEKIFNQANKGSIIRSLESYDKYRARFDQMIKTLKDGILKRSRAFGKPFGKSSTVLDRFILDVLVGSLSKAGSGLALSLVDSEAPEGNLIDRVLRKSIDSLKIEGIGDLDKEVLISAFADLFSRPTKEEGLAITLIAQAAVAHSLAMTFSGGPNKILELLPTEAYLDANVAIPLVVADHPRSLNYHELIVHLEKVHCDVLMLDVFLDEMVGHCRLAFHEMREAKIKNREEAKEYAEFHGSLAINAFVAAYAAGSKAGETFHGYLRRNFGSTQPTEKDFRRAIEKLSIEVVSTKLMNKAESQTLAVTIAEAKSALMRIKAQVLAQHEALQIFYIHHVCVNKHVWFITEDATLRRILRNIPSLPFSHDPPSKGVMPAYGAYLLISSLSDRPNLESTFAQLLWNPSYIEQVETMLSSTLRKFPDEIKKFKKLDILQLRDKAAELLQKEAARTEKDFVKRRAREYTHGQPAMIKSILRELGEED